MNKQQLSGKWDQLMGRIQAKWGMLTRDDTALVSGRRKELCGRLHELYGISKEDAERELAELEKLAK